MSQTESANAFNGRTAEIFPAGLAEASQKGMEEMANLQAELFKYLQRVNRGVVGHMQSELALASEYVNRLSRSRSLPQSAATCQEWANKRIELLAEDGKRFIAETEKFWERGAQSLANGFESKQA